MCLGAVWKCEYTPISVQESRGPPSFLRKEMGRTAGRSHRYEQPERAQDLPEYLEDESQQQEKSSVRLGMWDFAQCDPKRCSGRRLCRLHVIEEFKLSTRFKGIILTYKYYIFIVSYV